jgi:hypothetical protein
MSNILNENIVLALYQQEVDVCKEFNKKEKDICDCVKSNCAYYLDNLEMNDMQKKELIQLVNKNYRCGSPLKEAYINNKIIVGLNESTSDIILNERILKQIASSLVNRAKQFLLFIQKVLIKIREIIDGPKNRRAAKANAMHANKSDIKTYTVILGIKERRWKELIDVKNALKKHSSNCDTLLNVLEDEVDSLSKRTNNKPHPWVGDGNYSRTITHFKGLVEKFKTQRNDITTEMNKVNAELTQVVLEIKGAQSKIDELNKMNKSL